MREGTGQQVKAEAAAPADADNVSAPRSWALSELGLRPLSAAILLMIADWCAIFACLVAVWWLRGGPAFYVVPDLQPLGPLSHFMTRLYGLAPWILTFTALRLYTRRTLFWEETGRIIYGCTLAAFVAIGVSFAEHRSEDLSRLVIGGVWLMSLVVVPVVRMQAKRALAALGLWRKRALIIGTGDLAAQVVERIRNNPDLGYDPVAFVAEETPLAAGERDGLPVHGPLESIPRLVRELSVDDVVVALPELPRERLYHLISICEGHVQSIRLVPDLFGLASVGVEAEDLDGVLLLHMRWNLAKPWNLLLKRGFDVSVALVTCALLMPLFAAMAIAIRMDSVGPVFFVQERLGRGRRRFACVKFRTMYVDADRRLRAHLAAHPQARAEWEHFAKLKSNDPRVTRVGRVLRRWSLDELAQMINVLRGEMSLVGPRPYLAEEMLRMGDIAETVLKAPPGITGLWQVSGRNNLTFDQRLRLDEFYTRNWSLWLDTVVLLKTIGAVVRGEGAY